MASSLETIKTLKLSESKPHIVSNIQLQIERSSVGQQSPTLWISGPPGLGKSEFMEKLCTENNWGLVTCFLSQMTIDMLSGMPMVKVDSSKKDDENLFIPWSVPEVFNFKQNLKVKPTSKESPIILFFDDAHLCERGIQKYMFQLLGTKSIHKYTLPPNVAIVLAGNRLSDHAGFQQILAPVANRIRYLDVRYDIDDWINNYAIKNKVRVDVISFLNENPSLLNTEPLESEPWASPRSWTYASLELDNFEKIGIPLDQDIIYHVVRGCVGEEPASEFCKYIKLIMKWEAEKILNGTIKVVKAEKDKQNIDDIVMGKGKDGLNRIDCYSLMVACIGAFIKNMRQNDYKTDKSIKTQLDRIKDNIIIPITHKFKPIIPLGLSLLLNEIETFNPTQTNLILKRLLDDEKIKNIITELVSPT